MDIVLYSWILFFTFAGSSVFLLSLSKVGFGGGAGNLATPLMALVVSAQISLGILLPLLCICDMFAIYYYRRKWDWNVLKHVVPFSMIGVVVGSLILGRFSDMLLKQVIGVLAVIFVFLRFLQTKLTAKKSVYKPKSWHSYLVGWITGIASTISHSGGPILTMFLLPQKFSKEVFMGSITIFFAVTNVMKIPPYMYLNIINQRSLELTLYLIPLVGLGALAGKWLNRNVSDRVFNEIVYVLLLLSGIQLIIGINPFMFLKLA